MEVEEVMGTGRTIGETEDGCPSADDRTHDTDVRTVHRRGTGPRTHTMLLGFHCCSTGVVPDVRHGHP